MRVLKKIIRVTFAFLCGVALAMMVFWSVHHSLTGVPTVQEIQEFENVSRDLPFSEQLTIKRSRQSTVRILSLSDDGRVATSTGTYFISRGKYYILTVMHGLVGDCDVTRIWSEVEGFTACNHIVIGNVVSDYAIIEINEIPSLRPIPVPRALPPPTQWKQTLATQSKIYYTGFPNSTGPLTFSGRIIGYAEGDFVYLDSFAWGGASGSGVFAANGDYVGYILAIDIGETIFGADVLENIVVVVPAFKIDWATILE
jgi:hypothetical protein